MHFCAGGRGGTVFDRTKPISCKAFRIKYVQEISAGLGGGSGPAAAFAAGLGGRENHIKMPASRLGWLDKGGIATGSSERTGSSRFYDSTGEGMGLGVGGGGGS